MKCWHAHCRAAVCAATVGFVFLISSCATVTMMASETADDRAARLCAFKVGTAHPRGVVTPVAFNRCMQRQEASRIRKLLREAEAPR